MKQFLVLIFAIFSFFPAQAQVKELLKEKLKNGAASKASDFNTSRSNKEKGLNLNQKSTEEAVSSSSDESTPEGEAMPGEIDSNYDFLLKAIMETVSDDAHETTFYLGNKGYLNEDPSGLLISDVINGRLLLVDEAAKQVYTGSTTPVNANDQTDFAGVQVLNPTGQKKDFDGIQAVEFLFIDGNTRVWIGETTAFDALQMEAYHLYEQALYGISFSKISGLPGMMLQLQQMDEQGKLVQTINLKSIQAESRSIDLNGYSFSGE